jgi:hypothetical protein
MIGKPNYFSSFHITWPDIQITGILSHVVRKYRLWEMLPSIEAGYRSISFKKFQWADVKSHEM